MDLDVVIIVDDHPLFRSAMKQTVLEHAPGAMVVEADSLAALQDRIEQHKDADLLLLDLHIPGANGFSALAHVRARDPQLPVIMVSAP